MQQLQVVQIFNFSTYTFDQNGSIISDFFRVVTKVVIYLFDT